MHDANEPLKKQDSLDPTTFQIKVVTEFFFYESNPHLSTFSTLSFFPYFLKTNSIHIHATCVSE